MAKSWQTLLWGMALVLVQVGCVTQYRPQCITEGTIRGGSGKMLYLEEVGIAGVQCLDSLCLDSIGHFTFSRPRTPYPMFYRLRLGESTIPFVVDSLTHLVLQAEESNFYPGYRFVDADRHNLQLQDINLRRDRVEREIERVVALYAEGKLDSQGAKDSIDSLTTAFKVSLASRYIYLDPKSPAAYFALVQRNDEGSYFSMLNPDDERAFAAVATAYDLYYPDAPYTPFLRDMARGALMSDHTATGGGELRKVASFALPNLNLPDSSRKHHSLRQLAMGSIVLLSITSCRAKWLPRYEISLQSFREKYPNIKVCEVCVDGSEAQWRAAVQGRPGLHLYDDGKVSLKAFDVKSLPAFFFIRDGVAQQVISLED